MHEPRPLAAWLGATVRRLDAILLSVVTHERGPATMRVFSIGIYVWLLAQTLAMMPYGEEIWGPDAFVIRTPFRSELWFHWITHFANHPALDAYPEFVVAGQVLALCLGLWGRAPRLASVLVYVFTICLYNRIAPTVDGGNNLSYLLLFYSMIGNLTGRPAGAADGLLGPLRIGLSNVAYFACRLQVALVYACAAIFKLQGKLWQSGMALYYILQSDSFSHPLMYDMVVGAPWLAMGATYGTMLFQICFPILIWFRATRTPLIVAGLLLHTSIAVGMGLVFFGWMMGTAYLLFMREESAVRVLNRLGCRAPLVVEWPKELVRVLPILKRLDLWRSCRFEVTSGPVRVADQGTGERSHGDAALLRVLTHGPLGLALLPLLWPIWVMGGMSVLQRLMTPRVVAP